MGSPKPGWGTDGWGESSVDEIDALLECIYTDTELARVRGQRAAEFMAELSWRQQVNKLVEVISRHC